MSIKRIKISDYKRINESEEASSDKEFQEHLDDAMNRINNEGELPEDVFDVNGDWGSGCLRIKLDGMYNMLTWDRSTKQYRLLFDKWYIHMGKSFRWGWLDIAKYDDDDRMVYNYINKDGEIFWHEWFTDMITDFNKDGYCIVEFDGYYIDILSNDQGCILTSRYGDNWRIDDNFSIQIQNKNKHYDFNAKNEDVYIIWNGNYYMAIVDGDVLETNHNDVVQFKEYDFNKTYRGYCKYFLFKGERDYIYNATYKEFAATNEILHNIEDHDDLFIGDTDDGKIAIHLYDGMGYNKPYIAKGYKSIDICHNGDKIICTTDNNKTVYLDIDTLEPLCHIEFDEVIEDNHNVIIGKSNNKYYICVDGKLINETGFDYAEAPHDVDEFYISNNNTWNILDDRGNLLLSTPSSTKPHWSDYNDAYVLTINGKRALLKFEAGNKTKLVTENLNENIIDEEVSPEDVDLSSFAIKDELCPDFWEDGRFDQSARRTLLAIAKSFIEHLEIEDEVEDITITGSIANYNWDENSSDIDLHILMDFSKLSDDPEILKKFFDAERKIWNKDHYEISIYGYPVEVYVQDINEEHHSSGIYSLLKDEWVKEPSKDNLSDENTDYDHVQEITSSIMTVIDELKLDLDKDDPQTIYNDADTLFNNIKDIRKSGMGSDSPEMSDGNIIFKSLRRSGYMEKLIDIRTKAFDMIHSI